jgi:hypothetical protein
VFAGLHETREKENRRIDVHISMRGCLLDSIRAAIAG